MAKLSLSEVSNRFNVSRSTLYRAIKEGRISRSSDGLFDIAEVIRCFGEPIKKHEQKQEVDQSKDDADLRQLVDFMKKEIESYKDREKRYLDQIDRFQLLLGHKESEEKISHDAPVTHPNDAPCDKNNEIIKDKKRIIPCIATEVNIHNAILEFASYCKKQQNKHCKSKKKELKLFVYVDSVDTSESEFIWLMPETLTGKHLFGKIVEEISVDNCK